MVKLTVSSPQYFRTQENNAQAARLLPTLLPKCKVSLTLRMVKSSLAEAELGRSSIMRNPDDWYHLSRECPALNLARVCFCKE